MERDQADRLIAVLERIAAAMEKLSLPRAQLTVTDGGVVPEWLVEEIEREAEVPTEEVEPEE